MIFLKQKIIGMKPSIFLGIIISSDFVCRKPLTIITVILQPFFRSHAVHRGGAGIRSEER